MQVMTNFVDSIPIGPKVPEYDFRVVYYTPPYGGNYRDQIVKRLKEGMTIQTAIAGFPVSFRTGYRIAKSIGRDRTWIKQEYRMIGDGQYDQYDIAEMYSVKGCSVKTIMKLAKCSPNTVLKVLKRMGVQTRKRKDKSFPRRRGGYIPPLNMEECKKRNPHRLKKLNEWKKKHGAKYLAAYNDVAAGMTIKDACKKNNTDPEMATWHFKRLQKRWLAYLDFGKAIPITIKVHGPRLEQWEWAAKQSQLNVLDWIKQTLNRESEKQENVNARNKSRTH